MPGYRLITRSNSKKAQSSHPDIDRFAGASPPAMPTALVEPAWPILPSGEGVIGLALGSPSESPLPSSPTDHPLTSFDSPDHMNYLPFPRAPSAAGTDGSGIGGNTVKTKGARWKAFGGLFSRKDASYRASERQPFYQLDREHGPEQPAVQAVPHRQNTRKRAGSDKENGSESGLSRESSSATGYYSILRRSSTRKRGLRKKRHESIEASRQRARTFPPLGGAGRGPLPPVKDCLEEPQDHESHLGSVPFLEVDIPSVELERYSVMFGQLLSPNSRSLSRSSLLARRQARLTDNKSPTASEERLPDMEDLQEPHRRDISPARSKSPSFSLFPSTPSSPNRLVASKPLPRPSPLSRAVTSPETDTSMYNSNPPNGVTTKIETVMPSHISSPQDGARTEVEIESPNIILPPMTRRSQVPKPLMLKVGASVEKSDSKSDISPDQEPNPPSSHQRNPTLESSSHSTNTSQPSLFESPNHLPSTDSSSPTPKTTKEEDSIHHAFPARESSLKAARLKPPKAVRYSSHQKSSDSITTLAEVSIARQISISRRQRQLLVPIVPKNARHQPLQPRLVELQTVQEPGGGRRLSAEESGIGFA